MRLTAQRPSDTRIGSGQWSTAVTVGTPSFQGLAFALCVDVVFSRLKGLAFRRCNLTRVFATMGPFSAVSQINRDMSQIQRMIFSVNEPF